MGEGKSSEKLLNSEDILAGGYFGGLDRKCERKEQSNMILRFFDQSTLKG